MTIDSIKSCPGWPSDLPTGAGGPVFRHAWEVQAFAITVALHERRLFTWPEWSAALGREITKARQDGDPDMGDTYTTCIGSPP